MNVQELLYDILPTLFGVSGRIRGLSIYLARDIHIRYDGMTREMLVRELSTYLHVENNVRECLVSGTSLRNICGDNVNTDYLRYFTAIRKLPQPIAHAVMKHFAPNMHLHDVKTVNKQHEKIAPVGKYGILCTCDWMGCLHMHSPPKNSVAKSVYCNKYVLCFDFQIKKQIHINNGTAILCLGGPTPMVCHPGILASGGEVLTPYVEVYDTINEVAERWPYHSEITIFALQERVAELEKIIMGAPR